MTDRPSDDGKRARSDAASRLAALLADVADEGSEATPEAPSDPPVAPDDGSARRRGVRRRGGAASGGAAANGGEAESKTAVGEATETEPTVGEAAGSDTSTVDADAPDPTGPGPATSGSGGAQDAEPDAEATAPVDVDAAPDPEATAAIDMSAVLRDLEASDRREEPEDPSTIEAGAPGGPSEVDDETEGPGGDTTVTADPGRDLTEAGDGEDHEDDSSAALAQALATAGTGEPKARRGAGAPSPAIARASAAAAAPAALAEPSDSTAPTSSAPTAPVKPAGAAARAEPSGAAARAKPSAPAAPSSSAAPEPEVEGPKLRRVTLRAVAFGAAFLVLLAAVPALGWVGKERLLDSRGGNVVDGTRESSDPGYKALVEPTQTALVIQRATSDGPVVATTLLSLGMGRTGGTVVQIPLDTEMRNPVFVIDRLAQVAEVGTPERLTEAVEDRLNLAIPTIIELDDELLASLVAPVAPLTIDNPDQVITDSGQQYDASEVQLSAEELGPFLRAGGEAESDLGRLARNEVVWTAWLDAIGQSDTTDSVGPATTGIGPFLRTLSGAGAQTDGQEVVPPVVETLDVEEQIDAEIPEDAPGTVEGEPYVPPLVPAPGFDEQVLDAVPFPRSPGGFGRYNLKLLNGAAGEEIPRAIINELILRGAALTTLGNAASFGQDTTTVEYTSDGWKDLAELAGQSLGGAEVSQMPPARAEAEGDDIVVTVGQDVLDRYAG